MTLSFSNRNLRKLGSTDFAIKLVMRKRSSADAGLGVSIDSVVLSSNFSSVFFESGILENSGFAVGRNEDVPARGAGESRPLVAIAVVLLIQEPWSDERPTNITHESSNLP